MIVDCLLAACGNLESPTNVVEIIENDILLLLYDNNENENENKNKQSRD